jgi:hypothetical protein
MANITEAQGTRAVTTYFSKHIMQIFHIYGVIKPIFSKLIIKIA